MRAAIYARRSTDEHQEESLDVQVGEARRFIERKGWTHEETLLFVDDAVSRAEFKKRTGLIRLTNAAAAGAFDVVVTRDETRIGGDLVRTGIVMQDLVDAGVRVWFYYADEELRFDDSTSRFLMTARNFASELEREKVSQRVHEHLLTKARRGLVAGGAVFGYDNVRRPEGGVVRVINPAQAEVVVEMFTRRAEGEGFRSIAKELNGRRVAPPRAGKRGTGSWSGACVAAILSNELYAGVVVWNRSQKTYRGGTKVRVPRPESELIRVEIPELRIVPDELWQRVRSRDRKDRAVSSRKGQPPRYLLTGLARCATCGGPMNVANGRQGTSPIKVYVCNRHRERGDTVCTNKLRRPVDAMDAAVISWIERNVLTEDVVLEVLEEIGARLAQRQRARPDELSALRRDAEQLRAEIGRLTEALATGVQSASVVQAIASREEKLRGTEARIAVAQAAPKAIELEIGRLKREARARLAEFRELMGRNTSDARKVLSTLLNGPITCTPEGRRYRLDARVGVPEALGFRSESVPSGIFADLNTLRLEVAA